MKNLSFLPQSLTFSNPYVFILFLGFAVGLAWLAPDAAAKGGWLHPEVTTKVAIFVIFFLQGLSLPADEIKNGLLQYRTHLLIQAFIFILIPALVWCCMLFAGGLFTFDLRMGFLFLAAVPTNHFHLGGIYHASRRVNHRGPLQCCGRQCFGGLSGAPVGFLANGAKCGAPARGRHDDENHLGGLGAPHPRPGFSAVDAEMGGPESKGDVQFQHGVDPLHRVFNFQQFGQER